MKPSECMSMLTLIVGCCVVDSCDQKLSEGSDSRGERLGDSDNSQGFEHWIESRLHPQTLSPGKTSICDKRAKLSGSPRCGLSQTLHSFTLCKRAKLSGSPRCGLSQTLHYFFKRQI